MRRIVSAGLPSHIASFLARQLGDVSVLMTFSGDDTLTEVRAGRCGLLLLDSEIPGLPAASVLRVLAEDGASAALGIVCCLAEGDKAAQEVSRQHLLREFPSRVLAQPLSLADVARVASQLLDTRRARDLRAVEGNRQPTGHPLRTCRAPSPRIVAAAGPSTW